MQSTSNSLGTIRALLAQAETILAAAPHPERARRDAEALLLYVLRLETPKRNRAWLLAHESDPPTPDVTAELRAMIDRRAAGEPIQHITGETEFYGLPFLVNRDVLIPRPETELLVEKVFDLASQYRKPRILDVGTGSGAIAVALAHERPEAIVTATDVSAAALRVARENADRNGVANRIRFREGDLFNPVVGEQFDIIVSNPPYVPETDRDSLSIEVRKFEPAQALFAGADGLAVYRQLIPAAFATLSAGGFVVFEIGYGQQEAVRTLMAEAGFEQIEFAADLQGIARVAWARRA